MSTVGNTTAITRSTKAFAANLTHCVSEVRPARPRERTEAAELQLSAGDVEPLLLEALALEGRGHVRLSARLRGGPGGRLRLRGLLVRSIPFLAPPWLSAWSLGTLATLRL